MGKFWKLIDNARSDHCQGLAESLQVHLKELPADEIVEFDQKLRELLAKSYRWDLWAVAYIANGGCSDDCFEYFRAWLIARGRDHFEAALRRPELAVEGVVPGTELECEPLLYVTAYAYEAATGQPFPMGKVVQTPSPMGQEWTEEDLPRRYPALCEKFW